LVRNRGRSIVTHHGTRFNLQRPGDDLGNAMHVLAGDGRRRLAGPTGDADGPYTLTYTSDPTSNPDLMSATLERRFSNGLGNTIDENAAYAMLTDFGLSFAVNEDMKQRGAGFARKFATMGGGITAA
jgi:hypothetical protein